MKKTCSSSSSTGVYDGEDETRCRLLLSGLMQKGLA